MNAADLITEAFRRVGIHPGEDDSVLIADQLAMAIAPRDAVTAEEIRRRFAGPVTASRTRPNGSGPTGTQGVPESPFEPF